MTIHARWMECNQALSQAQYVCRCGWRSPVSGDGWYVDIEREWQEHLTQVRARLDGKFGRLADLLFELEAIQFGAFKLKLHETQPDAPLSPIFLNLRTPDNPKPGPLTPEALQLIGDLLYAKLHGQGITKFKRLAGIPNAGDPLADVLMACCSSWPVTQLHLGKEEVAGNRRITGVEQGYCKPGDKVLLLDDLITQADSKFEAIQAVQTQGLVAGDVLVLVDREQGGSEQLMQAGYSLYSVYTLTELLNHYIATGQLDHPKAVQVAAYIGANQLELRGRS